MNATVANLGVTNDYILRQCGGCERCSNSSFQVLVPIMGCPTGFNFSGDRCICNEELLNLKTVVCNPQSKLIENSGENWLKPNYENSKYNGILWSCNCPRGYCKITNTSSPAILDFSSPNNSSDSQCVPGVLCGTCEDGYSLSLYNLKCVKCSNVTIAVAVLFMFAGVALIALLLVLKIHVAARTINGLMHRDMVFPQENRNLYFNPLEFGLILISVFQCVFIMD